MNNSNYRFLLAVLTFCCAIRLTAQQATNAPVDTNAIRTEMEATMHQVEKIVNQPVAAYRRAPGMHVSTFKEGWFHPGALKPPFLTVDVRQTQETPYDKYEYVSSDLNPGLA